MVKFNVTLTAKLLTVATHTLSLSLSLSLIFQTHHPFSLFILSKRETKPNQTKTLSLSLSSVLVTELQFGLSFTVPLQVTFTSNSFSFLLLTIYCMYICVQLFQFSLYVNTENSKKYFVFSVCVSEFDNSLWFSHSCSRFLGRRLSFQVVGYCLYFSFMFLFFFHYYFFSDFFLYYFFELDLQKRKREEAASDI